MEMNLDPGTYETVINLRGPCKLDVIRGQSTMATVEVPSEEVYKLVVRRKAVKESMENALKG